MKELPVDSAVEFERYEFREAGVAWDRREFFRIAGGGVVIALLFGERVVGQQRGGRGGLPQEVAAWLHVGEDGVVQVFTGKVELGQNARTSLTQVVAEELRTPVGRIHVVMADTAKVPYDAGTFGSQTTPVMAAQLRRAAAAAREALLDLAAARADGDRSSLTITDGKVTGPGGRTFEFGELTKGQKLVRTVAGATTTPAEKWTVAGTSVPKVDGRRLSPGRMSIPRTSAGRECSSAKCSGRPPSRRN